MIRSRTRLQLIGIYALGIGLLLASALGVPLLRFRTRRRRRG